VVLPSLQSADIVSCQIHEPSLTGNGGISQLGLFAGTLPAGSAAGRSIPTLTVPLTPGTTDPANWGLGAIIGITGAQSK
jgi:hypothetical protein